MNIYHPWYYREWRNWNIWVGTLVFSFGIISNFKTDYFVAEFFRFGSINYLHDYLPCVAFTRLCSNEKFDEFFPSLKKITVSENRVQKLIAYLRKVIPVENAEFSFVTNVDFDQDLAVSRNPPSPDQVKWLQNTFPNAKLGTTNSYWGKNELCEENNCVQPSFDTGLSE